MVDLKKVQSEIDEMSKALEYPTYDEEDVQETINQPEETVDETVNEVTEEVIEEAHEDIKEVINEGNKEPELPTKSTKSKESEEDPRDKAIRDLREEIDKLKNPPKDIQTGQPEVEEPSPIPDEDFLADIDFDDIYSDPKLFKDILNRVYKKAREDARKEIKGGIESVVRSIPDITKNTVAIQAQLAKARDEFYNENKDLLPWSASVAAVMEELISKNPDKHYNELLPEVAIETRRRLNIQKQIDNKRKDNPPPLPRKKGGQRSTTSPDLSDLDKAIAEMDKALGL